LARHNSQPTYVDAVRSPIECAVQLRFKKSSVHEKIFDFLARVNSVTECEAGDAVTVEDGPFVSYACPIIDDLVSLDEELTRGQLCGRRRLKDLGEPFLTHHIEQEDAACLQTFMNVAENFEVVGLVFEVPEGREHVDSEIKAHVLRVLRRQ